MGPLSLYLLRHLYPDQTAPDAVCRKPWHEKQHMTLIQIQALNGLKKGNIRSAEYGVLSLQSGVYGGGENLFRANFRPGAGCSWHNASKLCQEVARTVFDFDLLFVQRHHRADAVRVLCPACRSYWTWQEMLKNDLRKPSGRLCARCSGEKLD